MKKGFQTLCSALLCVVLLVTAAVPAFAALGTVKSFALADTTPTSVTLKWSAVSGAKTYELQRLQSGAWKKVAATKNRTYTVKGLQLGTTYSFRVRALKGSSAGAFSKTLRVSPAPAKVTGLKAAAKSSFAVKLTWDKQSGVTGYRVQQYINGKWTIVVKKTSANSAKIKNLTPDTTYKFRVCAYKKTGGKNYFGSYCKRLAVKTTAITVPTGLKATSVSDTKVVLKWNKVSGAGAYLVYSVKGSTQTRLGMPEKNAFTVKNLTGGTDYIFCVKTAIKTKTRNYYSKFSDNLSVRTAPPAVTGFKAADVGNDEVTLNWKKSKNAQGYRVEQLVAGSWKYLGSTDKLTYTVTGLEELTAYQFRVRPYHKVNGSNTFGAYSAVLKVTTAKASVKGLKLTDATDKSISLSWDAMADATGYVAEISTDGRNYSPVSISPVTADGTVSATVSNLVANTGYDIHVSAVFRDGTGLPAKLSVRTAPAKVEGLRATGISGGVSLSWNVSPGADGYEVAKSVNSSNWEAAGEVTDTTAAAENLPMNVKYYFRVRAFYSENGKKYYGGWSDPAFATALPPAVKDLAAGNVTTTSFTLSWTKQADAQAYKVSISANGAAPTELSQTPSFSGDKAVMTIGGRTAGTEYTMQVCAVVSGVTSAPSVLTVKTVPDKVTGLTAAAASGSEISLRWTAVAGADYYEIQQKSGSEEFKSVGTAKQIPHVVSGLAPQTEYTFRVRAVNTTNSNAQQGEFSAEAKAKTTDAPTTPTEPTTEPTPEPTTPTTPTTPGGRTPSTDKKITGITTSLNENGNSFALTWTEVDDANYAVEMLNPSTNKWEEVISDGLWARMTSSVPKASLGVKCAPGADSATTVTWNTANSATGYEVRTEVAHGSGKWETAVKPTGSSATLRLAPNYLQTIRVSVLGKVKFRIFALDVSNSNKQLAYAETEQTVYLAYEDCDYTTPAAGSLSASSSAGDKEAYVLMLTQAVNNTRYESGKLSMVQDTELKANASDIDAGLFNWMITNDIKAEMASMNESETSKTTCTFNNASGTATRTVTKADGTTASDTYTAWQYFSITPTAGKTFLKDQHDLSSFSKAIKSVSSTANADGTSTVTIVLNKEAFSTSQNAVYHPGFVDTIADNKEKLAQSAGSGTISNAYVGETTLTAKINKNYTLDSLDISSPYTMLITVTGIKITFNGSSVYKYTFTR